MPSEWKVKFFGEIKGERLVFLTVQTVWYQTVSVIYYSRMLYTQIWVTAVYRPLNVFCVVSWALVHLGQWVKLLNAGMSGYLICILIRKLTFSLQCVCFTS